MKKTDNIPDVAEVRRHLEVISPYIHLWAKKVDSFNEGRYFGSNVDEAVDFVVQRNGGNFNCYFTPNIPTEDCGVKPSKSQIAALRGLHLDIDAPQTGELWDKAAILNGVKRFEPTYIVDSGNGIHAYWNFPEPIEATPESVALVEALNRALIAKFGGDPAASNVDRLMRIPGTINWPDAKKRSKGRSPVMARTLQDDTGSLRQPLSQLHACFAPFIDAGAPQGALGPVARLAPSQSIVEVAPSRLVPPEEALAALRASPALWRVYEGDISTYGNDDSRADQALVNALAPRTGWNAELVERLWLNSPVGQRQKTQDNEGNYRGLTISKAFQDRPYWAYDFGEVLDHVREFARGIDWHSLNTSPPSALPTSNSAPIVFASQFEGRAPAARPWNVPGMIPGRTVTLLSGDGGTGKSLVALQLAVATAAARDWFGSAVRHGPCLFVTAEDDIDEIHRRTADVGKGEGVQPHQLAKLAIWSLAGHDALFAVPEGRGGTLTATPGYEALRQHVQDIRPALIVLDTLADMFGGNEVDRAQTRQFVGMLRGLALEADAAVLLLSHPSLTGISSGSGLSGSTAWNNSVRSRLYLRKDESDPNVRILETMKANYGAVGQQIRLTWEHGIFVEVGRTSADPAHKHAAETAVDDLFLKLLAEFLAQGRDISPNPKSQHFAPLAFSKTAEGKSHRKAGFVAAMERLFQYGRIRVAKSNGPPSKQIDIIVPATSLHPLQSPLQ
jgi:RecA-family ATPase